MAAREPKLGEAEQAVMDIVWARGQVSAEAVRLALEKSWPMKESTVRTVLTRLEAKGFVKHRQNGRAFEYLPATGKRRVAASAVRAIIDRFCHGSPEELVLGLVQAEVLKPEQLQRIARQIASARKEKP